MDLIKCPECGEMYSSSYPHCPFCEEDGESSRKIKYTPRRHIADKQKALSARGGLVVVLILVLALLGWYLFGGKKPAVPANADGAQTAADQPAVPASNPSANDPFYQPPENADAQGGESGNEPGGDTAAAEPQPAVEPQPVEDANVDVSSAALSRSDFTLSGVGDSWTVKVSGTEATPHWSIDNGNVASIDGNGKVTAKANGTTTLRCKVGTRELTCIVRVSGTGKTAAPADAPTTAETVAPTAPAAPGTASTAPATTPSTTPDTSASTTPSANTHVDLSAISVWTSQNYKLNLEPGAKEKGERLWDCTVKIGGDSITLIIKGTDVPVSSWTSSDTSIVEVSQDGKLTLKKAGTTYVTAAVGDATVKCIIRVK